jgi:dihydrofolate synthase/folylpolyglutamate synthase
MSSHALRSYAEAIDFWFGRVNFELASPRADDFKLDRIRTLLRLLGNPHERLRIVHVAGSKGKGSTSAMLASILRRAGYRTGLFTSPHLCHVEERIQVDGQAISAAELIRLLEEVRAVLAGSPQALTPTFFEIATALGFLHFVRRRVEIAIIEVGLGGRFDSTNVCRPLVALITSISFDHTQQLGNRLASIAMEKAGIVKPGRPAISGAAAPEARATIERIGRERNAPLQQIGVDFHYSYEPGQVDKLAPVAAQSCYRRPRVRITTRRGRWPVMELGLLGEHQAAKAAVAVASIVQLRAEGLQISDSAVATGLAGVCWPARMEVTGIRPLVVLDCAHNVASAEALVETLRDSFPAARRFLVFASSNDKDLDGIFGVLAPQFAHAFLTRYNNSRSVAPQQLGELLARRGQLPFTLCASAGEAYQAASTMAGPDDLICITGSVFLAGELCTTLQSEPGKLASDRASRR